MQLPVPRGPVTPSLRGRSQLPAPAPPAPPGIRPSGRSLGDGRGGGSPRSGMPSRYPPTPGNPITERMTNLSRLRGSAEGESWPAGDGSDGVGGVDAVSGPVGAGAGGDDECGGAAPVQRDGPVHTHRPVQILHVVEGEPGGVVAALEDRQLIAVAVVAEGGAGAGPVAGIVELSVTGGGEQFDPSDRSELRAGEQPDQDVVVRDTQIRGVSGDVESGGLAPR